MSEPLRVAFVGRASEAGHAVPADPADGLHASFVEHRARAHARERARARRRVTPPTSSSSSGSGACRPPPFARSRAPVVAWTLEAEQPPGFEHHPDLPQASKSYREAQATAADYARVIDRPLPVADEHFRTPGPWSADPRIVVIGHSSPRGEQLLVDSKHRHELLHVASGLRGEALAATLAGADAAIDVRADDRPAFGPRVALYLAAGLLLLSERLDPRARPAAGATISSFATRRQLVELLWRVRADPASFTAVRDAGRAAAESMRASRVYPDVLAPLAAAHA